jgi:hypothetical protein
MNGKQVGDGFGFRAWIEYADGEQYTMLVKGCLSIADAAARGEREAERHNAACVRVERWSWAEERSRNG